ncbi:MAG: response regulator [Anaerolineales bacterium]|nr:response regulator [Anaerolineales bacterium]
MGVKLPKVLLAEDDMTMLSLLKTLLKMEGFQPVEINLDEGVLQAVVQVTPDIVLLDVHLPRESGLEAIKEIRASEDVSGTRVVMTSGMNLKEECILNGADAFLLKPYMPDELIALLKDQLEDAS